MENLATVPFLATDKLSKGSKKLFLDRGKKIERGPMGPITNPYLQNLVPQHYHLRNTWDPMLPLVVLVHPP